MFSFEPLRIPRPNAGPAASPHTATFTSSPIATSRGARVLGNRAFLRVRAGHRIKIALTQFPLSPRS